MLWLQCFVDRSATYHGIEARFEGVEKPARIT